MHWQRPMVSPTSAYFYSPPVSYNNSLMISGELFSVLTDCRINATPWRVYTADCTVVAVTATVSSSPVYLQQQSALNKNKTQTQVVTSSVNSLREGGDTPPPLMSAQPDVSKLMSQPEELSSSSVVSASSSSSW